MLESIWPNRENKQKEGRLSGDSTWVRFKEIVMRTTDSQPQNQLTNGMHQIALPLLMAPLGGIFIYYSWIYFGSCVDVLRYTIPAVLPEQVELFSETAYWQQVGLLSHFLTMPVSAQRYFILYSIGFCLNGVLSIITFAAGFGMVFGKILKNRFCKAL